MDRRNDPSPPSRRRDAWGRRAAGGPWSAERPAEPPAPTTGPWSRWNRPAQGGATFATPFTWAGGSLLLAGTTFLVSIIALVRAFVALID